jgi:hypothetical protein
LPQAKTSKNISKIFLPAKIKYLWKWHQKNKIKILKLTYFGRCPSCAALAPCLSRNAHHSPVEPVSSDWHTRIFQIVSQSERSEWVASVGSLSLLPSDPSAPPWVPRALWKHPQERRYVNNQLPLSHYTLTSSFLPLACRRRRSTIKSAWFRRE